MRYLFTYISIILFESLFVVEVVHNFLLVPLLNIRHEVDPSRKVAIVIITGVLFIAGSVAILEIIRSLITLAW